jgi:hypothetical protein
VSLLTVPRTAVAVVAEVASLIVVEPVREGRLRASGWPTGLRAVVALGMVGMVVASVLVLAAPSLRRYGELTVALGGGLVFPRWSLPVLFGLSVLTLALLHTASLHLMPWLRIGVLLVVVLVLLSITVDPPDQALTPNVVSWVGAGLLALFTAARWRAAFRWWEFVVSLVLVGGTAGLVLRLVAQEAQPLGFDVAPLALVLTMQVLSALAVPFIFVAGIAFAQLATMLAHRVGDVVEERVRWTPAVAACVVVVGAVNVALVARHLSRPTQSGYSHLAEYVAAAVLLAAALGLVLLAVMRAAPPASRALDDLEGAVSGIALPVALLVTVSTIPNILLQRVDLEVVRLSGSEQLFLEDVASFFVKGWVITTTRVVAGLLLVAWAVWQRRRRPLPSVLAAAVGVTLVVTMARRATSGVVDLPWTSESLNDVAALAALAVLVGLAVTRRLTRRRLVALGIALGLSLAYSVRATFDAPFVALLGLGTTAAVFIGVWWATLTDADDANSDSPRWPRPARVLLFVANALLALTTLGFYSLARTSELGVDVSPFATLGDDYLGTGLLLAAYSVLAWDLLRGGAGDVDQPVDTEPVLDLPEGVAPHLGLERHVDRPAL